MAESVPPHQDHDEASGVSEVDDEGEEPHDTKASSFRSRMLTTAFGMSYDLKHWSKLPPNEAARKAHYVVTTNGRFPYVLIWLLLLALFVVGVATLASGTRRPRPHMRKFAFH